MYHLLIVDDERHVVDSLSELFRLQADMELEILTADNGFDALEIFQRMKIDVVLLDIKMPGLSGIDVYNMISVSQPSCKVIFLTGYSSFDYIYQISNSVNVTYLLKTEDNDKIVYAVKTALNEIDNQHRQQEFLELTERTEKLLIHLIQRDIFNKIVKGIYIGDISEHIAQYSGKFGFNLKKPIFLVFCKLGREIAITLTTNRNDRLLDMIFMIEKFLQGRFIVSVLEMDINTDLIFLQPAEGVSFSDALPEANIKESLNDLVKLTQDTLQRLCVYVMYHRSIEWNHISVVYELLHRYTLSESYYITELSSYAVVLDEDAVTNIRQKERSGNRIYSGDMITKLTNALYKGDENECLKTLNDISSLYNEHDDMHTLQMIRVYQSAALVFIDYIIQYNLQDVISSQKSLYRIFHIDENWSWEQGFDYLRDLSVLIFSVTNSMDSNTNFELSNRIKSYIDSNISGNLSLTNISNHINYNSAYVSRIFKQVTGTNLSTFIMNARIEKAKELLSKTNDSIKVIAEKTGFKTPHHFSGVFKKATNFSPTEYRKRS